LIFLERDGILPANIYEEENNKILKDKANFVLNWPTFEPESIKTDSLKYAKNVIDEWFAWIKV